MAVRAAIILAAGRLREFVQGDVLRFGYAQIDTAGLSAARTITLPDKAGTLAMLSDVAGGISLAEARKTVSLRV